MKRFNTAYRAAKHHAETKGRLKEFEENGGAYIRKLVSAEVILPVEDKRGNIVEWDLFEGTEWFVFDEDGDVVSNHYKTKKAAMKSLGVESSTRIDTGVYRADGTDKYVARHNSFYEWWDGMELASE